MKPLYRVLPVLVAVTLLLTGIEKKGSFNLTAANSNDSAASVNQDVYKKGSFDITEVSSQVAQLAVLG